ncbi:hypothetical protein Vafri_12831 [Volvox africanus]|uniref:Uncharacterized protein n=1 Tax=Volvox africanus TaxID=51714 RepID=A0A8J4BA97_9CHLO|nr:hypothetical protein Vafri_12831 [Volvox africanus]
MFHAQLIADLTAQPPAKRRAGAVQPGGLGSPLVPCPETAVAPPTSYVRASAGPAPPVRCSSKDAFRRSAAAAAAAAVMVAGDGGATDRQHACGWIHVPLVPSAAG